MSSPSYTDPFGGSTIYPALVAYRALALNANKTLVWPFEATAAVDNVFARLMDVTPSGGGFSVTLPDATRVSVGFDVFFSNLGSFSYTIKANNGSTLATVAAGEVRYLYLTSSSTSAGTWRSFNMGALLSTADASALAGKGLAAAGATLQRSDLVTTFGAPYTVLTADRSKVLVWTGGVGTLTLPTLASATNDFSFSLRNNGSGALTVDPNGSEVIDDSSAITLQPGESCLVHAGTVGWYTIGRGRNRRFSVSLLSKTVDGGSDTLSQVEASHIAHIYTGVLVANQTIVLPEVVQVYYISNQTTGDFTLTLQTSGMGGATLAVPQGANAVVLTDGLNVLNMNTISPIFDLTLNPGSAASPPLNFVGDANTGLFQSSANHLDVAIDGAASARFSTTLLTLLNGLGLTVPGPTTLPLATTIDGLAAGYRGIPKSTDWANGKCWYTSSGQTLDTTDMVEGYTLSICNSSATPFTITQGAGVTLRLAGSELSGNLTLGAYGFASIWCASGSVGHAAGPGLTLA